MERRNPYDILGIDRGASPKEIRAAYLEKARSLHSDLLRARGVPEEEVRKAEEEFKQVNWANEELADPQKRRQYEVPPPILHVNPPTIRSTNVTPGTVLRASFVLYNTGGPPFAGSTISSGKMDPWIKFLPPESVDPNQKELLPLRIHLEVRVDAWNTRYTQTITISIAGVSTSLFVELQTKVRTQPQPGPLKGSRRASRISRRSRRGIRKSSDPDPFHAYTRKSSGRPHTRSSPPQPIPAPVSTNGFVAATTRKRRRSTEEWLTILFAAVGALIFLYIIVDCNSNQQQGRAVTPAPTPTPTVIPNGDEFEIKMSLDLRNENDAIVWRITVSSGESIAFSAYTLDGNIKWEKTHSNNLYLTEAYGRMYLSPKRLAAIDYNEDGLQEEVLILIGGRRTKPGGVRFRREEELFLFFVYDSDGYLLHNPESWTTTQKAEAYHQEMVKYYGGNNTKTP